ncbi:MAG: CPBP family intramembrane glutamic endopeptidase [Halanaerobiales bacterium]
MLKSINWKLYGILLLITIISLILGLPYVAGLQGAQITFNLFFRYIGANGLIAALAIYFGLLIGKKINLGVPILRAYTTGEKLPEDKIKSLLKFAPLMGLLFGLVIYATDLLFAPFLEEFSTSITASGYQFVWWKSILAAFYGGIFEEILMRLFALTFYAWILTWIIAKFRKEEVKENKTIIWVAIILSAVLFGISHLPALSALATLTPLLVFRTVLLNALPGIFFGWLYYRRGLENAMVSHFFADIAIHLILPLFLT